MPERDNLLLELAKMLSVVTKLWSYSLTAPVKMKREMQADAASMTEYLDGLVADLENVVQGRVGPADPQPQRR